MARDYRAATDVLLRGVTLADVAEAAGMSEATVRRARLDEGSSAYRTPPQNWREVVARLARQRARELERLADELELTGRSAAP